MQVHLRPFLGRRYPAPCLALELVETCIRAPYLSVFTSLCRHSSTRLAITWFGVDAIVGPPSVPGTSCHKAVSAPTCPLLVGKYFIRKHSAYLLIGHLEPWALKELDFIFPSSSSLNLLLGWCSFRPIKVKKDHALTKKKKKMEFKEECDNFV